MGFIAWIVVGAMAGGERRQGSAQPPRRPGLNNSGLRSEGVNAIEETP